MGDEEGYVLDKERFHRQHLQKIGALDEADGVTLVTQRPTKRPVVVKEEYGELDRPEPAEVIAELKERFVSWDQYKMSVMQNLIREQKKSIY